MRPVTLPGPYTPQLEPTETVTLPWAYALPRTAECPLEVLRRHGVALATAADVSYPVERFTVEALRASARLERAPKVLELSLEAASSPLAGYLLVLVDAENARALATFLEPAAKYALHRFTDLLPLHSGTAYPVLRVREPVPAPAN